MKTTLLISCALVGALAACSHKSGAPPQSPDTATNTNTSVTTSYQQPPAQEPMAQPTMDTAEQTGPGAIATTGVGMGDNSANQDYAPSPSSTFKTAPNGGTQPALNEPQANAKPVQPAQPGAVTNTGKAKSSTDQGESKSEVKMTASIRKRLMASKTLSFGAKNVKIVTQGSTVTLVGNVKSDAEKNEIEGIAKNTDGITNVDDQLVVKQ